MANPQELSSADEAARGFNEVIARSRPPTDAVELAAVHRALRAKMLDRPSPPLCLDRYEIRSFLGVGGHGAVYEAFDPKLERRVAIKILKSKPALSSAAPEPSQGPAGPQGVRLLREARAIARASDPRVVAVYDVAECPLDFLKATGEREGGSSSVFMVMEYVEGRTLRRWREEEAPHLRESLRVFLEAARGLEAAHRAFVVHGDFKPENVLITADGQVKILDFGIARTAGTSFRLGVFAGTRSYASPEQLKGLPLDERSDQYSFCVALYEALHGIRPQDDRRARKSNPGAPSGALSDPAAAALLARLDPILARGLRRAPNARYRSMAALIGALERASRASQRKSLLLPWLLGGLAALTPTAKAAPESTLDCVQTELGEIWQPERAARLERAFLATGLPYAKDSWGSVSKELARYAAKFSESAKAACSLGGGKGARAMAGASTLALASRPEIQCLEERHRRFGSLLDVTEERAKDVLPQVVDAVFSLRTPSSCLALAGGVRVQGEAAPACAAEVESELYALDAALTAGTVLTDGVKKSEAVRGLAKSCAAQKLGAWAELVYGLYLLEAMKPLQAAMALRSAFLQAESAGDAQVAMRAITAEIVAYDERGGEMTLVDRLVDDATARANTGGDVLGPDLQASFLEETSRVRRHQGRYEEALQLAERAVRLREKHWGPEHPLTNRSKKRLADVYYRQRDFRRAEAIGLEVLKNTDAWVGSKHPDVAGLRMLLGNMAWRRGQYERALSYFAENERFWGELFGPDSERTTQAIRAQANVQVSAGDYAAAWAKLEPLLARFRNGADDDHVISGVQESASRALAGLGRYEEAEILLDHATRGMAAQKGADHFDLADPLLARGRLELARGKARAAVKPCAEAVERWGKLGERHPKLSWAYACLGIAELESGNTANAVGALERASSLFDSEVDDPVNLAEIEFALARALKESNPARSRVLLDHADALYVAAPRRQKELDAVRAWRRNLPAEPKARGARP